jgi:anaerobic magnesium-protoporphyrin IX monomethyl ester cyclase
MRVALVKPPATYADWYKRPVLGLSYLAAIAEQAGRDCRIFDAYFHSWTEAELLDRVLAYQPDVVGFTAMTHEVKAAGRIAARLKERSRAATVVGGCHVTALPERTLTEFPAFDYGVCGEGERTFLELLEHVQKPEKPQMTRSITLLVPTVAKPHDRRESKGLSESSADYTDYADGFGREPEEAAESLGGIRGLAFRDGRNVRVNEPRPLLTPAELDALPIPAFHHYYGDDSRALAGKGAEYVIFSGRGCPFGCAFCMRVLGQKVRRRSAGSVCREMEAAIARYGAHTFDFEDDVMLVDNKDTRELLQMMIDSGLAGRVRWSGMIHAAFVKPDLVALAKRAGCYQIWMGVESGDDQILKTINKGITVEQVRQAVRVVKQARVRLGTFFILGHPGETDETARKTIDLMAELNTNMAAVGLMVPYPGTGIHAMAERGEGGYRLLTDDWAEYDKYGGRALEIDGLPWERLARLQRAALVNFYLKNLRLVDLARYAWRRRRAFRLLFRGNRR